MIGISRLYCGCEESSDQLRYGRDSRPRTDRRPVVVWNCTRRCNLACRHCYSASNSQASSDELTTAQAQAMIDDLAAFRVPGMLFSGGEPLLRPDVVELIARASAAGIRPVISTNGTAITPSMARALRQANLGYAGVSLDGLAQDNDAFRGRDGAFDQALAGIRNCIDAGVKVGLRLTLNRHNVHQIDGIFDLLQREAIPRVCFYHLAYTGRGDQIRGDDLTHQQTRTALDLIVTRTAALHAAGHRAEVLTVDNHADGPYLYMRLLREDPAKAQLCLDLLRRTGGNSSGIGIGCVSWNGDVLPDQFWRTRVLGSVLERPFSQIWSDGRDELLARLRERPRTIAGRCARCRWLEVCNGNLRARAQAAGDEWGDDPACYLSDQEIEPLEQGDENRTL